MLNKAVFHMLFLVKDVFQTFNDFFCNFLCFFFLLVWDFIRIGLSLDKIFCRLKEFWQFHGNLFLMSLDYFTELLLECEEICNKIQVTGFDILLCIFDQSSCISKGGTLNICAFSLLRLKSLNISLVFGSQGFILFFFHLYLGSLQILQLLLCLVFHLRNLFHLLPDLLLEFTFRLLFLQ